MFAPITKQNTINRITNKKQKINGKQEKNNALEEAKRQRKIDANSLRQKYGNNANAKPIINKHDAYMSHLILKFANYDEFVEFCFYNMY